MFFFVRVLFDGDKICWIFVLIRSEDCSTELDVN